MNGKKAKTLRKLAYKLSEGMPNHKYIHQEFQKRQRNKETGEITSTIVTSSRHSPESFKYIYKKLKQEERNYGK